MKQILILAISVLCGATTAAHTEPNSDAAYIVEQHLLSIGYKEKWEESSQGTLERMQTSIKKLGAEITDPNRFLDELMGSFHEELMLKHREASTAAYLNLLTPQELAALAQFYQGEEGQALLAEGITGASDSIVFFQEGPGAAILHNLPELLTSLDEANAEAIVQIYEMFSLDRIADILEMEDVVKFDDESHRKQVVDALRRAN